MKLYLALALIVIAAATRLLPHPPNFTPIAAMGLFGAAYLNKRWMAIIVPFAALFISDLVLNNGIYNQGSFDGKFVWMTSPWIYIAFIAVIGFGGWIFRNGINPGRVLAASLGGSLIFFLISNFWSWYAYEMYPKNAGGLLTCYVAGLPFFINTLLGDLMFSALLFGIYTWVSRRYPVFAA